ncbi:unnamed protein product [Fusarium graminearum]|nr:unnamed protein product [Fusarium graminearum]
MDFVKNAMGGGNKDGATNSNAGGAQKEDYVDKAARLTPSTPTKERNNLMRWMDGMLSKR